EGYGNFADESLRRQLGHRGGRRHFLPFNDSEPFTAPVARFKKNPLGLFDMLGNVWEWCHDGPRAYRDRSETEPSGPQPPTDRVCRGGSWDTAPTACRVSFRFVTSPWNRICNLSFRIALIPFG